MLRTQEDDSIMCGFYCTAFKENMLNQNIDYIKLFSPKIIFTIKRMTRKYISTSNKKMAKKSAGFDFRLKNRWNEK